MSQCILHIGWHKTGTTSLQQFSYQNRDKLAAVGVHYPDWNHNHGAALVSAFRQDTGYYFAETFVPPHPKYAHIGPADWGRSVFQDAIRVAKGKTLLLSGEDCVLLHLAEINALAAELKAQFETVKVVAYLRNHRDFLNSAVQQLVRMGFTISDTLAMAEAAHETLEPLRVMSPIPAYGARLLDWIAVFGKDNVYIHNYDLMRKNGQDTLSHFYANHLSEEVQTIVTKTQQRSNSRFSATAIDLLDCLHSRTPPMLNGHPNARFTFNLQRFFGQVAGPTFQVGEAFDRSCVVARETDRPMLEAILSDESLENLFQDHPQQGIVSVAPLPEAIVNTFADISITAHLSQAREKFFAALNKLKLEPEDEIALGNLRVALFNLNAPDPLRSCASWLLREKRYALAQLYLNKAEQVGAPAASLVKMRARLEHNV